MEAKLAAYRRQKEEEKQAGQSLINKLKLVSTSRSKNDGHHIGTEDSSHTDDSKMLVRSEQLSAVIRKPAQNLDHSEQQQPQHQVETEVDFVSTSSTTVTWALRILKILLWFVVWGFFIELQFGAVFFSLSALIFVYFNTRTGPKDNKPSAYSVFNKDCERIQGTLTAEQMQRQMFGVPGLPA